MTDFETARKLFAQQCDFVLAAAEAARFPPGRMPEVAFIGRSNVGKSSLLNALTGRKNLARASNMPGRTQQIVFFNLGDRLMLADLPGYGHAQAPPEARDGWNELVRQYLRTRPALRCVLLLLDARHGALANDLETMKFLDRAAPGYQIVLTKADKVAFGERALRMQHLQAVTTRHAGARPEILLTSAGGKPLGIEELRHFIGGFALPAAKEI